MDFQNILTALQSTSPVIQKDTDPSKYDAVAAKLCEKRKLIELKIADSSLDQPTREELAFDLIQIKESMKVFGISEIDYQAYIHQRSPREGPPATNSTGESIAPKNHDGTQNSRLVEPD